MSRINYSTNYSTPYGLTIQRQQQMLPYHQGLDDLIKELDTHRGAVFASRFEFPGRYTCWDIGFMNPPLVLTADHQKFSLTALNERGEKLLAFFHHVLQELLECCEIQTIRHDACTPYGTIIGKVKLSTQKFPEELRSKQPSIFSVLRQLRKALQYADEPHLGWYGAFGYDLAFQFEHIQRKIARDAKQRSLVLYLPDALTILDHRRECAQSIIYDFSWASKDNASAFNTQDLPRIGAATPLRNTVHKTSQRDHQPGEYAKTVAVAKQAFQRGDLFEVVPSQLFQESFTTEPSILFQRLLIANPAPYCFFINLGEEEYLVGTSPEMFVRVEGQTVETCPISGTIKRGLTPLEDAMQIHHLLNSNKDESELTMCTDVDRNDKSRICEPGSVNVIGRRQIEMYSRLIHTVDHVRGTLRPEFDAIDAFLTHTWVVTVTGAPKQSAMQFIEDHEKTPRCWYAGAVGWLHTNGDMNTGLTIRTIRIQEGVAEVRAGATLLYDSDPDLEEQETELKASALLHAIRESNAPGHQTHKNSVSSRGYEDSMVGLGKRILLVDHKDSFVHTLANYLRRTGATVITWRYGFLAAELAELDPDLVFLSPGPGRPCDFNLNSTIAMSISQKRALFGVCLGLQGIVEYFEGKLKILETPIHGKASKIILQKPTPLFANCHSPFIMGRYHSLYADESSMPACLDVTALSDDGVIMAIEHQSLPIAAVQFHPESILSLQRDVGMQLIENLVRGLYTLRA